MNKDIETIFSKVPDKERLSLFEDLAKAHGDLFCKGTGKDIYRLVALEFLNRQELHCSVPARTPRPFQEKELFGNFFLGGERYFFKSTLRLNTEIVILRPSKELFHLQRRQNYRIKIPESYHTQFLITSYNNTPVKLRGHVSDLSSGGCKITLPANTPTLETNVPVEATVRISYREPFPVSGIVRHSKIEKSLNNTKQTFGVEFTSSSPQLEGKLFAIIMDLHREFFSNLND